MRVRRTLSRGRRAHKGPGSKDQDRERRLELLIRRLPPRFQCATRWLRQPAMRWLRISVGFLLVAAEPFGISPILGLWMLSLGLVLLSDVATPLRRVSGSVLPWIERRYSRRALGGHRMASGQDITAALAKGQSQCAPQQVRSRATSATDRWRSAQYGTTPIAL
jgi:hypothetical protein